MATILHRVIKITQKYVVMSKIHSHNLNMSFVLPRRLPLKVYCKWMAYHMIGGETPKYRSPLEPKAYQLFFLAQAQGLISLYWILRMLSSLCRAIYMESKSYTISYVTELSTYLWRLARGEESPFWNMNETQQSVRRRFYCTVISRRRRPGGRRIHATASFSTNIFI